MVVSVLLKHLENPREGLVGLGTNSSGLGRMMLPFLVLLTSCCCASPALRYISYSSFSFTAK